MLAGKVVGSIVSTRKHDKLVGNKFMIVEVVEHMKEGAGQLVAVDNIGAGIGDYVLVAQTRRLSALLMMEQDWSSEHLWR